MTTKTPEKQPTMERRNVILSDAERRNLRRKLRGSVEVAQDVLNPKTQLKRLVDNNKLKAKKAASDTGELARKNAPILGAVGVGALIFAARRPISKWISSFRRGKEEATEQESI